MDLSNNHIPVMPKEVISFLRPKKNGIYLDATLGGGGHTRLILKFLGKNGKIIVIDQDIQAIESAQVKLKEHQAKINYFHDNFKNIDNVLKQANVQKIDGALFDFGTSNFQLKNPERGFSFSEEKENLKSSLDMRMNTSQETNAQNIVNEYQENELVRIFLELGEEPYFVAKKIAKNIVLKRKFKQIKTIYDLLEIIKISLPPKNRFNKTKNHYATNIFRAIRMEVNQELNVIKEALPKAINYLKKDGRLIAISFHSLEDRIVKQTFKSFSPDTVKILTKKPIMASNLEVKNNRASDSAKLRVLEKL